MEAFIGCIALSLLLILVAAAAVVFFAALMAALVLFFSPGGTVAAITAAAILALLGPFIVPFVIGVIASIASAVAFCISGQLPSAPVQTLLQPKGVLAIATLSFSYIAIAVLFGMRENTPTKE